MSYRLYGKKDRIQLLWVMSVPNATPESIGVSEGSQRDEALKGQGVPWLMLPGHAGRPHHDSDQQVATRAVTVIDRSDDRLRWASALSLWCENGSAPVAILGN